MLKRTRPMRKASKSLCAKKRAQRRAYQDADIEKEGCCFSCKKWAALDPSHILPQGMYKALRAVAANVVGECRACHTLWGEHLPEYAAQYPDACREKVARMEQLSHSGWALWMMKNDHLLA